jgi:hypothetical protein
MAKEKIRLTVVALLKEGVTDENIPSYIEQVTSDEDPAIIQTIFKTAEIKNQCRRFYVKISKVIDKDEMKDGWHLRITERFGDAGCDDVAWKITEFEPWDADSENTTESFPMELFQSATESDANGIVLPEAPFEPFGSDAFWESFDKDPD